MRHNPINSFHYVVSFDIWQIDYKTKSSSKYQIISSSAAANHSWWGFLFNDYHSQQPGDVPGKKNIKAKF